jgi:hypothetical protein
MFLGLPDPDPLVRGTDPDTLSSSKKNIDSYCFVTFYEFLSLKNDVNALSKRNNEKNF